MKNRSMGKFKFSIFVTACVLLSMISCNDTETYAERKARETDQINAFLAERHIQVILLDDFLKDSITNNPETGPDKTLNEYVLFPESGVYVQIIRRGTGKVIADNENRMLNVRYLEYNIATADTVDMNLYKNDPDVMKCSRTGDYYSASFISGSMLKYGPSVPTGWIVPMPFLKPDVLNGPSSAKVNLIVPHDKGNSTAMNAVQPYYYELIISSQKWQ